MADEKRKRLILDPSRPPFTSTMIHTPYRDSGELSITYSSGLIPPPEHMSTLAVFYDKIWLPSIFVMDNILYGISSQIEYYSSLDIPEFNFKFRFKDRKTLQEFSQPFQMVKEQYEQKINDWKLLSDNGIIQINSPKLRDESGDNKEIYDTVTKLGEEILYISIKHPIERIILAHHILLKSKPAPELFISNPLDTTTSRLAVSLAQSIYSYMVPQLQTLNSEQILEVRDYLKDAKEGFRYYINEMTDEVERRIQEHNLSDIEATQKTFERKIQPQYEEFRRKLAAKKTGFWSRVAVAGGKFLQVDAAPWTPKFLGAVLELCGVSLDEFSKVEQENFLSNKSQAFNYIATLSEVSKRLP